MQKIKGYYLPDKININYIMKLINFLSWEIKQKIYWHDEALKWNKRYANLKRKK